jgi:hypothetical protein
MKTKGSLSLVAAALIGMVEFSSVIACAAE